MAQLILYLKRDDRLSSSRETPFSIIPLLERLAYFAYPTTLHNLQSRTINCPSDMQPASTQTQNQSLHAMARFSSAECRSLCQSPINTALNTFVFRNFRIALVPDRYLKWLLTLGFKYSVLLLAIICSYIPQLHRIITKGSTWGIAPNYILFNTLFAASQLTLILYLSGYGFPVLECIGSNKLKGLNAYGAVLGLIQISVLWLGSLSLYDTFRTLCTR